jgi:serine/threonine protein kinase
MDAKYTNKVDIWAIGCILYEIIFKKQAFSGDGPVLQYSFSYNSTGTLMTLPFENNTIPNATKSFISKVILNTLDIEPTRRPGADQLHQKFNSRDFDIAFPPSKPDVLAEHPVKNKGMEGSAATQSEQVEWMLSPANNFDMRMSSSNIIESEAKLCLLRLLNYRYVDFLKKTSY